MMKSSIIVVSISPYPDWFKHEVAEYAKVYGQRAVSRMMVISQKRIFEWLQLKPQGLVCEQGGTDTCPSPLSSRSRTQLEDFDVEKGIYDWVQTQAPVKVSSTAIRDKGREMYRAKGLTSIKCSYGWYRRWSSRFNLDNNPHNDTDNIVLSWMLKCYDQNSSVSVDEVQKFAHKNLAGIKPGFCASAGWATRFLKRHHLLLNCPDMFGGSLPTELEKDFSEFLSRMQNSVLSKFATEKIGSMDEIPICFSDLSSDQFQLQASPRVKKFSIIKCDATVILTVMGNGEFLPPLVILKDENQAQLYQIYSQEYSSIVVYYDENTGPTMPCLNKWYELVWCKSISGGQAPTLLFLDDYSLHHEFKSKLSDCEKSLKIELYPAGCSCKLQPLNASIKRQFLSSMEEYWQDHLRRESPDDTKLQHPSTDQIIQWVSGSYEKLKQQKDLLRQAFPATKLVPATSETV